MTFAGMTYRCRDLRSTCLLKFSYITRLPHMCMQTTFYCIKDLDYKIYAGKSKINFGHQANCHVLHY